jgi:hypothetical protein
MTKNVLHAIAALAVALALGSSGANGQTIFDVNAAFLDNETPNGSETNPFGQYTYGYNLTPGTPSGFSAAGLSHTDAFNGNANVEGYFINNNAIVPAILQNTSGAPNVTNFGVTLNPSEILLHPGGVTGNAFAPPHADAILRFTVPDDGEYDIVGNFRSLSSGATDSRVLLNGVALASVGDGGPFSILDQQLSAGDFIDFAVGSLGDIGSDSTGLTATITQAAAVPEPATIGLWALAGAVGIAYGLRRRGQARRAGRA